MRQPDLYYFETIKMTSQALSNFVWRIRAAGVLSCRATLFERLRNRLLSLQVSSMCLHKPDLLLFRSMAGTDDLLSKHALGIL